MINKQGEFFDFQCRGKLLKSQKLIKITFRGYPLTILSKKFLEAPLTIFFYKLHFRKFRDCKKFPGPNFSHNKIKFVEFLNFATVVFFRDNLCPF